LAVSRADFPYDDDGEVLFRLASKGLDLTRKREIEYYCYAENEAIARQIADDLNSYGYRSSVYVGEGDKTAKSVSVYSAITMLPAYDQIVLEQKRLDLILKRYGTRCDGWMTESTTVN
jgi:hypothetical protein